MSAQTVSPDEMVRRLQIELDQLRKMTDDLTEFRGVRFAVETSRGTVYDTTVSGALAFAVEVIAKALREAAAGTSSDVGGVSGSEYGVPLHYLNVRARRVT